MAQKNIQKAFCSNGALYEPFVLEEFIRDIREAQARGNLKALDATTGESLDVDVAIDMDIALYS